ncbi:MAG: trypsin-like peptidase domain-containing protein [Cyanobacteria bacterium]|nr:trypsin-like peptidase domain-containing protein [Cyanobacteriota bacterium]
MLDREGLILTNAHVLTDAATVMVTLADGRSRSAQIVGRKGAADVAVLRIKREAEDPPLQPLALGRSDRLVAGQWAIAIGHPLGLDRSVTVGVVSAPRRRADWVGLGHRAVEFIQTDAAINPGNSGGPLLNDRGRAIGISTAIRADVPGVGFAIPIEDALRAADLILKEQAAAANSAKTSAAPAPAPQ